MEAISTQDALRTWFSGRGARPRQEEPLGQILLAGGRIDEVQLERALAAQRRDRSRHLGRILVEQGALGSREIDEALAGKLGIPRLRLDTIEVMPQALSALDAGLARRHQAMPVARLGDALVVALANPFDGATIGLLRFGAGLEIVPALATAEEIALAQARHYSSLGEGAERADDAPAANAVRETDGDEAREREANRAPIVRLLDSILLQGVLLRASDINIRPERTRIGLYYRVDGRMRRVQELRPGLLPALVSRVKIVGHMNIAERRLAQEGGARLPYNGREIDLRLSVIPTVHGESVVIRLLDREAGLKPLGELGLPEEIVARLRRLVGGPHGLFLVTGPTGSGKSTTLYSLIDEIRARGAHVLTVEDPVEYTMCGVEQVQVSERIGYTFPEVLRRFLRHDPDVIMVGEIRDAETAAIACRAALTGHLVMSTLHTNDAPSAVARLIDMGIEPYVVASALRGVMAQRLVRLTCDCRKGRVPGPVAGSSCTACGGSGFAGRRLVCEVMAMSPGLATLVSRNAPVQDLTALAREEGMQRLSDHAMALAREGLTSPEEALSVASA